MNNTKIDILKQHRLSRCKRAAFYSLRSGTSSKSQLRSKTLGCEKSENEIEDCEKLEEKGKTFDFRFKFKKCQNKRCKTCPFMNEGHITEDETDRIFCKESNCIYLIKCKTCGVEYVGQTGNCLNLRMNGHRSDVKNFKFKNDVELNHYQLHNFDQIDIQIVGYKKDLKERLLEEGQKMIEFKTLYPYGLNNLFNGEVMINELENKNIKEIFDLFKKDGKNGKKSRGRGNKRNGNQFIDVEEVIKKWDNWFDKYDFVKKIKTEIFGLRNSVLKVVYKKIQEFGIKREMIKHLVMDLIKNKLKMDKFEKKKILEREFCMFEFENVFYDKIFFKGIFKRYEEHFPLRDKIEIVPSFKYGKKIGKFIFNHKEICESIDEENEESECRCNQEIFKEFVDEELGHIVTGDLKIIESDVLREICSLGTNFRIETKKSNRFLRDKMQKNLLDFILKMAYKYSYPIEGFNMWKRLVFENLNGCLEKLNENFKQRIDLNKIKNEIGKLHEWLVFAPVDKANGNIAIVCKEFYKRKLREEILNEEGYKIVRNENERSIKNKIFALYKKMDLKVKETKIPYLYLTVKMHKKPVGFRGITNGVGGMNKVGGKYLQEKLQIIFEEKKTHNWIIGNNQEVIRYENNNEIESVKTYD